MAALEERVAALEAAVAALTDHAGSSPGHEGEQHGTRTWILDGLKREVPRGAVAFAGHLETGHGPVGWQWGRTTDDLLGAEWDEAASPLAALGHPVRLRLLHLVLTGTDTTGALAAADGLGTSGQLHHHLRTLTAAGWLVTATRGRYEVPAHRIVPLLAILSATL